MSEGLKHRIAGTIVLGILGLIVLPLFIDFADPEKIDRTTKIPPAPSIKPTELEKVQRPDAIEVVSSLQSLFDGGSSSPVTEESKSFGLDDNKLPTGWFVQVGSFSEEARAVELQRQLSLDGYKVFNDKVKVDDEFRFRVSIGPKIDKRRALADKAAIDEKFGTDSMVVSHQP